MNDNKASDEPSNIVEQIVDFSKLNDIKQRKEIILNLFKTNIEFDPSSAVFKSGNTHKSIIYLYGTEKNRSDAIKYLRSICNPEFVQTVKLDEKLTQFLNSNNYKLNLIKNYKVDLQEINSQQLLIRGTLDAVTTVKCIIDLEINKLKNSPGSEDDLIIIDPEGNAADSKANHENNNFSFTTKTKSHSKISSISENENESNQQSPVLKLNQVALLNGFGMDEIEKAFKELRTTNIGESEFLEYLKATRNLEKKQAPKKTSLRSTPEFNYANQTQDLDCLIVDYIPSSKENNANTNTESSENSSKEVLNEYANMFEAHKFDKNHEQQNKYIRLNKLISAMPDNKKADAIIQVSKYSANKNKSNKIAADFEQTTPDDVAKNIVDETNIHAQSEITKANKKPKSVKYDPKLGPDDDDVVCLNLIKNLSDKTVINTNYNDNFNSNNYRKNMRNRNNGRKSINARESSDEQGAPNTPKNQFRINRSKSNNPRYMNIEKSPKIPPQTPNQVIKPSTSTNQQQNENSKSDLKFIIIDGSNIAREHGKEMGKVFSCKGIKIVVDYFVERGHKDVKALVPRFRRGNSDIDCPSINPEILDELEENGYLTYTPSRYVKQKLILPYDDRFILKAALHYDAIIVSNDNYRDLMVENSQWKRLIETNLLQYSFIGDLFMIADDPMGRHGPNIDEFLTIRASNNYKNDSKFNNNAPHSSSEFGVQKNHHYHHHHQQQQQQYKKNFSQSTINTTNISNSILANATPRNDNENSFSNRNMPGSNGRDYQKTIDLFTKLKEIFPNSDYIIRSLLDQHPNSDNILFFTNLVLKYLDSNAISISKNNVTFY